MKELRKALTTTGDGEALGGYDLDPMLNEELLSLQPLTALLEMLPAEGKTHEYNIRTSHPMGWYEGEGTAANAKNSVYARRSVQLKIARIWGSVTGFAKVMDEAFVDALSTELSGSLEGMSNVIEYGVMYGCGEDQGFTGDAYQSSGLLPILVNRAPQNIIDAKGAKIALSHLDAALAAVGKFRGTKADPKAWIMGVAMKQVVDGLQTRISIPLTSTNLRDGQLVMDNYAKAPIYESDMVVPDTDTSSPDVAGVAAADGSLAAGDYTYRVASVTAFGEQAGGAASDAVTADGTNKTANLSWTADPNAKLYMVFRSKDAGDYVLVDIIPALTYDGTGAVSGAVESYVDNGSRTPVAVKPLEDGEECIFLVNRHKDRGLALMGKVDSAGRKIEGFLTFEELGKVKDSVDYMVKAYFAPRVKYPNTAGAIIRHVKTA